MKILTTIQLPNDLEEMIKKQGTLLVKKSKDVTVDDVEDCEIIIGNIGIDLLKHAKKMKWLQLFSAGSDMHAPVLKGRDCILCNASGTFGETISEHLMMVTLMLFRHMPHYQEAQNKHQFSPIFKVKPIKNSRFLILGTGDLGTQYAKVVKGLGGYTIGVKRTEASHLPFFDEVYTIATLDTLLSDVDVVCLCLPKNAGSDKLINEQRLDMLKKDAVVLNVGRSNALDVKALCRKLNNDELLGAALDVFDKEPISSSDPIWDTKNLIITPHVSGTFSNEHTYALFYDLVRDNINRYFHHLPLRNIVDKDWGY